MKLPIAAISSQMSEPIWSVVTENLAEQIAATQSGLVHPTQLLPYLPMSLEMIEETLDQILITERIFKDRKDGLIVYTFVEFLDTPPKPFRLTHSVYSDDPLDPKAFSVISPPIRKRIEGELAALAASDPWPAHAVWQHELVYLIQNLPAPVTLSSIAGHSRLPFRKVEGHLKSLQKLGAVDFDLKSLTYRVAPMKYPKSVYREQEAFIRRFPGARKEEEEVKLVKALFSVFAILSLTAIVAITAKLPFPLLILGGVVASAITFMRILKAAPKPLPEL